MPTAAAQSPIESPLDRMLTHVLSDERGAKVVISVRADVNDDALVRAAMEMLAAPPHPAQ